MITKNFRGNKTGNWSRLTAGWCALLLYAGACSPLGLALAALTGTLDPNHQLQVGAGQFGVRLVLHHGSRCRQHHHGLAARALALFAQPVNPANPDHILQFSSTDTVKSPSQTSAPQPDTGYVLLVFHGGDLLAHTTKTASGNPFAPPPPVSTVQLCLRSTVLLI